VIAAIELAILARLKAMEPTLGFSWRRLETLPDDWEAYLADKAGELRGPAVWVGFTGWRNAELWSDQLVVDGSFGLVVASSSSRPDEQANRHGGPNPATEPGSYRLALGAAAMLADQMLGLDLVEPISVGDADPLKRTARMKELKLSAHAMMLACRFPILLAGDDSDAALDDKLRGFNDTAPAAKAYRGTDGNVVLQSYIISDGGIMMGNMKAQIEVFRDSGGSYQNYISQ